MPFVPNNNPPFYIDAVGMLPERLYSTAWMQEVEQRREQLPSILTLPEGDDDFSGRWREIKKSSLRITYH